MFGRFVRERLFAPTAPAVTRVGVEVEFIPIVADTGRVCPIESERGPSSLALLRQLAGAHRWCEQGSFKGGGDGASRFLLPDGATISFEPGGQLELSSPPYDSVSQLVSSVGAAAEVLCAAAADQGVELLSSGIDPGNAIEDVPLQLGARRYRCMDAFFESVGPFGARMMRQTAAVQVSVDGGSDPGGRWRLLCDLAPYLTAMFANSRRYAGRDSGHASHRAFCWRSLDRTRTGVPVGDDPVEAYTRFALDAIDIMRRSPGGGYASYGSWADRGAWTVEGWETHLSTLFPEVRPRHHLEIRAIDAIPMRWLAAPLALICGLVYHAPTAAAARDLLPPVNEPMLGRAAVRGLDDEAIAVTAGDLASLGLCGARALGPRFVSGAHLEIVSAYVDRYTRRARAPADDAPTPALVGR